MQDHLIYLVRPGPVRLADAASYCIGQLDLPLSGVGIRLAHRLGRLLRRARPGLIVHSDLTRSWQTAEIIAHYHPLCLQKRSDLREMGLGEWEGLTWAEIRRRYPEELKAYNQDLIGYQPPGGESFLDCHQRTVTALQEILCSRTRSVVIVGHVAVNQAILGHLLELPLATLVQLNQDYGCYNVIRGNETDYRLIIFNRVPGDRD